jgi:hypothetical protein
MIDYQNGISVFVTNTYIHTYIHTVDDVVFYSILLLLRFVFVFVLSNRFDSIRVDSIRLRILSLPPPSIQYTPPCYSYITHSHRSGFAHPSSSLVHVIHSFIQSFARLTVRVRHDRSFVRSSVISLLAVLTSTSTRSIITIVSAIHAEVR